MSKSEKKKSVLDSFGPGGLSGLIIGPPKTGKSTLLGSWAELVDPEQIVLLCPKPQEIDSFMYQRHGIDKRAEVFRDHRWLPGADSYEADGYMRLMRRILHLYADTESRVVLLDPLTDAVQLASHDLMKGERASTPKDLRDTMGYWGGMRDRIRDLTQALVGLTSPDLKQPKHVFVAVHAQPTKEEDYKGKETQEGKAKGVQFFGDVLPMIDGSYRMSIAGEFSLVGYSSVRHTYKREGAKIQSVTDYVVQFVPDNEKHCGIRLSPSLAEKELPNNMRAVLEAVLAARAE
jgi:hypothetical protein